MLKELLKGLNDRRTVKYRLLTIFAGLVLAILIMIINEFNRRSVLFAIFYLMSLIIFYLKRDIFKIGFLEKWFAFLYLILVFQLVLFIGQPVMLALFVVALFLLLNAVFIENKKHKIKLEAVILITLTVVLVDLSNPIFQPRIEIKSIDDVHRGYVLDETAYGYQYFTLSVLPPLIPSSCTDLVLGYDVMHIYSEEYRYGITVKHTKGGITQICTSPFDFTRRIIKLNVASRQPIDFEISNKNLTRFWWISSDNNQTRISETVFFNKEDYRIMFVGDVSYIINNNTMLDQKINLWDFLTNDTEKLDCRLGSFRFAHIKDYKSGLNGSYNISDDRIVLTMPINAVYVPSNNYTVTYIQFDPYACDKT